MSPPANSKLIGRWRIVEADIWDRDYLDLCGPAMITITDQGRGEIAFGALQAGLDIEYSRSSGRSRSASPAPLGSLDYAVSLDGPPQSSWRSHVELGP